MTPQSSPLFDFVSVLFSARQSSSLSARFPSSSRLFDLGFSRWETLGRRSSDRFFDVYFARPRRRDVLAADSPCAFLLKALKPNLCGTVSGAALVEREIFLGSIPCPRLSPIVDFVRPRRLSSTEARRGCVVFPYFPGETLATRLANGETFSDATVSAVERQLKSAIFALNRRGWSIGELTPERVLLSAAPTPDAEPIATLLDFSGARRFAAPSLIGDASLDADFERNPTFDRNFELPPDVFFDWNASSENDEKSLRRLTRRLRSASDVRLLDRRAA